MTLMKRCKCGLVALLVFFLSILVCYINGYKMGNWTASTWIVLIFIATAAGFCLRCRMQQEDENQIQ